MTAAGGAGGDGEMSLQEQIDSYLADQPPSKAEELRALGRMVLKLSPDCKLWFLNGRNSENKIISNPNIGYGSTRIRYANGKTREFYQVGLSANATGISVYIMGLPDKQHLSKTYGAKLGKAKISGYCIRFKSMKDIDISVLEDVIAASLVKVSAAG